MLRFFRSPHFNDYFSGGNLCCPMYLCLVFQGQGFQTALLLKSGPSRGRADVDSLEDAPQAIADLIAAFLKATDACSDRVAAH